LNPRWITSELFKGRVTYIHHAWNSVVTSFGATILALIIAIPAAYSMANFFQQANVTTDILLWNAFQQKCFQRLVY